MKLWLDDLSPASEGWVWVKSVWEACNMTETVWGIGNQVHEMSLDHDLGDYAVQGGDAINFIDWMCAYDIGEGGAWWPNKITIHSGNPVGRDNMMRTIKRFGPYNRFTYNSAWIEE